MQMDLEELLTSSQAGSHASRGQSQEIKRGQKMTVTSGQKWLPLLKTYGLSGSLAKMSEALLTNPWACPGHSLTWNASGIKPSHLLFQLRVVAHPTKETDAGLLHTPTAKANQSSPSMVERGSGYQMWATPNTMDHLPQRSDEALMRQATTSRKGRSRPANLREQVNPRTVSLWRTPDTGAGGTSGLLKEGKTHRESGHHITVRLQDQVVNPHLWPTPTANEDAAGSPDGKMQKMLGNHPEVRSQGEGTLSCDWTEWLMGYPLGWTNLAQELPQDKSKEPHG